MVGQIEGEGEVVVRNALPKSATVIRGNGGVMLDLFVQNKPTNRAAARPDSREG